MFSIVMKMKTDHDTENRGEDPEVHVCKINSNYKRIGYNI